MTKERNRENLHTDVIVFLKESNKIERVYDPKSLEQAIQSWNFIIEKNRLSIAIILETHKILMRGKLDSDNLGVFRKYNIRIGGKEAKPWYTVPALMENWVGSVNNALDNSRSDEKFIKGQHVAFELIHPFADGNGRMGRILMNWTRVKLGLPILITREREKRDYYKWFHGV